MQSKSGVSRGPTGQWGSLQGSFDGSFMDCVYFSFTTYTTIGFGDISPLGDLKYLSGLQALTGLVLISWIASFLFVEMQKTLRRAFSVLNVIAISTMQPRLFTTSSFECRTVKARVSKGLTHAL